MECNNSLPIQVKRHFNKTVYAHELFINTHRYQSLVTIINVVDTQALYKDKNYIPSSGGSEYSLSSSKYLIVKSQEINRNLILPGIILSGTYNGIQLVYLSRIYDKA